MLRIKGGRREGVSRSGVFPIEFFLKEYHDSKHVISDRSIVEEHDAITLLAVLDQVAKYVQV